MNIDQTHIKTCAKFQKSVSIEEEDEMKRMVLENRLRKKQQVGPQQWDSVKIVSLYENMWGF